VSDAESSSSARAASTAQSSASHLPAARCVAARLGISRPGGCSPPAVDLHDSLALQNRAELDEELAEPSR